MSEQKLYAMRHSLAHIMAAAVTRLWPEARLGVGPPTQDGFYYDIDIPGVTLSSDDFGKIEAEMAKIIKEDQPFEQSGKSIDEALDWAKQAKQPYKQELLNDLKRSGTTSARDLDAETLGVSQDSGSAVDSVSFYTNGEFTDLCRGPHVDSTGQVGAYKLMKVAGAYWRGDETKAQMQRLYAVAFADKKQLRQHLNMLEEAKKRDHRKLGQELDLFTTSPLVGSGLPLFTPRGTVLRDELADFSNSLRQRYGFAKVWTPHITKQELYQTSGHWDKFGDELFLVRSQETKDNFVMKPMNCPHHTQIYSSQARSYRDLPLRYLETTTDYRDEKTGELGGLSRVRALTQDDSHVFCRADQIQTEIEQLLEASSEMYEALDMDLRVRLSYRDDSDGYIGEQSLWSSAQEQLKAAVVQNKLDYFEAEGEAAFYGPKIDFMASDALGREHQVATVQLDFVQPERFGLEYTDDEGGKSQPVMIHCALLGSIERFLSVYIEHTAGKFPVWLAPEQLRIITLNSEAKVVEFADKLTALAQEHGLRTTVDDSNESVSKKIRSAETMKLPYSVVIGDREVESGQLTPRVRGDLAVEGRQAPALQAEQLIKSIAHEAKARASKSSL